MSDQDAAPDEDQTAVEVTRQQLQRLTKADPRCRGLQLPQGIMLRYTLNRSLYFFLRTGVKDGKISTSVFASDSPYDRQKSHIGDVSTSMFMDDPDSTHIEKLKGLLRTWIEFIREETDTTQDFVSFDFDGLHE